jgi:hypothetical protein
MALKLPIRILLAACVLAPAAAAYAGEPPPPVARFAEETATSGITSIYDGDWEFTVGGGAASFDCNDDGFPDLFLAGGEAPANFYVNRSTQGGNLRFERYEAGLSIRGVTGAYPLDIDSDGRTDLVVLRVGENLVMRGLGDCRFERANEQWGFDGGDAWSTAFAAGWERGATWPTLAIGNYIDRNEEVSPWGSCTDNWLHRPRGENDSPGQQFAPPLPLKPSFCPLSMQFTDWNRSGTPSLRISNDREYYEGGQEQLWQIEPGRPPRLYTDKEGWSPLKIWGMGIASTDLDGDGYPEYFLTSMADNKLQTLAEPQAAGALRPNYKDIAYPLGLTAHRPHTGNDLRPSTAWHAQFEDVNNDGLADLFIAKGNVARMPDFAARDPNNLLLQTAGGKFAEASVEAGVASLATSRGGVLADLNLDGHVDLVVVNRWESAQIWRNIGNSGNWLQVRLQQDGPNPQAIGAWLEVRCGNTVQRREIVAGGGHVSGHAGWWHFGLGSETRADVRVIWPDGSAGSWQPVAAGGFYVMTKDSAPRRWTPG